MFGLFKRKRPIVYEQWITPVLDFTSDSPKFYAAVEEELRIWEVPELVTERIVYNDDGCLSSGREYLRVQRESLVFDILSAKFGRSWWFSCRSAVLPRSLRWWELLVFFTAAGWLATAYWYMFGFVVGNIAMGTSFVMLTVMMFAARTWKVLDDMLLQLPVIGAIYEALFRAESYYRDDARRMYVTIVDHFVREKVKEFVKAGGIDEVSFNEVKDPIQLTSLLDKIQAAAGTALAATAKTLLHAVTK